MTQPSAPELAKQGDPEAISSLINHLLQDKGVTTKAALMDACLLVLLKSAHVPEQQSSVAFIRKVMTSLGVESIKSLQVYGKQIGETYPSWGETLDLTLKEDEPKKQTRPLEVAQPVNWKPTAVQKLIRKPFTPKQLTKYLLLIVLAFLLPGAIYLLVKTPEAPVSIASPAPSPEPDPVRLAANNAIQPDPFRLAVNNAMSAAKLTQSAKTKEDWNLVAHQWQQAIKLMKAVPPSSAKYEVALKKAVEYQKNLDYASLQAGTAQ